MREKKYLLIKGMEILIIVIYAVSEDLKNKWKTKKSFLSKEMQIDNLVTLSISGDKALKETKRLYWSKELRSTTKYHLQPVTIRQPTEI